MSNEKSSNTAYLIDAYQTNDVYRKKTREI